MILIPPLIALVLLAYVYTRILDRQRLEGMAKADRQRRINDKTMRHSADQFLHL